MTQYSSRDRCDRCNLHPTRCTCQVVSVLPHHPDCKAPHGIAAFGGLDPETCCYCAALCRNEADPLDYRYGGPKCYCGKPTV